jgi:hypothetical protein
MIEKVKITSVKPNKNNPRTIKDAKFRKLVESIREFPEMLKLRPIIVNKEDVILGGNMRYKASVAAGLKEVWILKTEELTKEQEDEFVIKDNASYGDWDWDSLANVYTIEDLGEWGLDVPSYLLDDDDKEPTYDKDKVAERLGAYINNKIKQITLLFPTEAYEKIIIKFQDIMKDHELESNTDVILFLLDEYDNKKK